MKVCERNGVKYDSKNVEQRVAVVLKGAHDKCAVESRRKRRRVENDSDQFSKS